MTTTPLSLADYRDRMREYYGRPVQATPEREEAGDAAAKAYLDALPDPAAPREGARAFVTFDPESTATMITAPLTKADLQGNPHFMWLQGAFVGAEQANRNGAMWSTDDLELGQWSVKHGPLNWLHDERKVVGTIADSRLVLPNESAADAGGYSHPYISATSVLWKFLWPAEAAFVGEQAAAGRAFYSMECISKEIACQAEGCGVVVPYIEGMRGLGNTCTHITERSAARRFVEPVFLGGAIIVPPASPGWANAHLSEMRQAAQLAERAHATGVDGAFAEVLVAQVLLASRGRP